jgi:hypothetical protein
MLFFEQTGRCSGLRPAGGRNPSGDNGGLLQLIAIPGNKSAI